MQFLGKPVIPPKSGASGRRAMSKSNKPSDMAISVVIPAYNASSFIGEAIESVHSQAEKVHEIIVIDDGSTDGTPEVVMSHGEGVRCIRQENAGPSAARNRGIELAVSPLIAFLDADDAWTPDKITEQLAVFRAHPEVGLVASDMAETDSAGRITKPSVLAAHNLLNFFEGLDGAPVPHALRRLAEKNFIPTGTVIAKRSLLLEHGGFRPDIRYGEDLELWARIACRSEIVCLPRVHMLRRQHGANTTQAIEPMLHDLVEVMKSLRETCAAELKTQGADPDAMVGNALFDFAYWNFSHGDPNKAKVNFAASLFYKPSSRTRLYWATCFLPPALIRTLRQTKQFFS